MRPPEIEALNRARRILGRRARVRLDGGACVVERAEMSTEGNRYTREYGRGASWTIALARAAAAYEAMCNAHRSDAA